MEIGTKIAALDLGTNTFQLGIYSITGNGSFVVLYEEERFVKLIREAGSAIAAEATERATAAIQHYTSVCRQAGVSHMMAAGTEALRIATNGAEVKYHLEAILGAPIRIVAGKEEARLTMLGIQQAVPAQYNTYLHMDIGGGSTEFTLVSDGNILWSDSFPTGAAALTNRFHTHDMLSPGIREQVWRYLDEVLHPVKEQALPCSPLLWVGSSGSAETIIELLHPGRTMAEVAGELPYAIAPAKTALPLLERLLQTTLEERLDWPGLKPQRAEYFLMAALQCLWVHQLTGAHELLVSKWGLREGQVIDLLATQNDRSQSTV